MVSIYSETIYDETVSSNEPDGQDMETVVNGFNFPEVSVEPALDTFIYAQEVFRSIEFNELDFDYQNNNTIQIENNIIYTYDNIVPLFQIGGDILSSNPPSGTFTEALSAERSDTLDVYLDAPATIKPTFGTDLFIFDLLLDGAQTVEATFTVTILGRKP